MKKISLEQRVVLKPMEWAGKLESNFFGGYPPNFAKNSIY